MRPLPVVAPELAKVASSRAGKYLVVKVNTDAIPELANGSGLLDSNHGGLRRRAGSGPDRRRAAADIKHLSVDLSRIIRG